MVQERERGTVPKGAESSSDVGSEQKRVWERAEGRENGRKRERPLTSPPLQGPTTWRTRQPMMLDVAERKCLKRGVGKAYD